MSFTDLGKTFDVRWREFEENMREHPESFLLGSLAIGFLLQTLPIRSMVVGAVRLALFLAKPALVFWFGYRLYQWLQTQTGSQSRRTASAHAEPVGTPLTHPEI